MLFTGCRNLSSSQENKSTLPISESKKEDSRITILKLISTGDSIYSIKSGIEAINQSMLYFDSALKKAEQINDTLVLAASTLAKGRVYDAWNKDKHKTIELYSEAARLYSYYPNYYWYHLYIRHLVAHAYEKAKDTANASSVINMLIKDIKKADTAVLNKINFQPQLALISTEVGNYKLAEKVLSEIAPRSIIRNDSTTYNYLDYYFLTKARLDINYRKKTSSPYLDSIEEVLGKTKTTYDSAFFASELTNLYAKMGVFSKAFFYSRVNNALSEKLINTEGVSTMEVKLLQSELNAEKKKKEYEEAIGKMKTGSIWGLGFFLLLISALAYYLYKGKRKYFKQSEELLATNKKLDEKVELIHLMNKEIQHRIKNNLQMVFSLLQMQERQSEDPETIRNLQSASLRVESIASLHEHLLDPQKNIDFKSYTGKLINSVVNCLANDRNVISHLSITEFSLPANYYFPLALIINEWVTNSIKYASTHDKMLQINLSVHQQDDVLIVEYSDNGVPAKIANKREGLGLQIVNLLSKQIHASLTTLADNQYHYRLTIPYARKDKSSHT